jgi:hypothetical protein
MFSAGWELTKYAVTAQVDATKESATQTASLASANAVKLPGQAMAAAKNLLGMPAYDPTAYRQTAADMREKYQLAPKTEQAKAFTDVMSEIHRVIAELEFEMEGMDFESSCFMLFHKTKLEIKMKKCDVLEHLSQATGDDPRDLIRRADEFRERKDFNEIVSGAFSRVDRIFEKIKLLSPKEETKLLRNK